MQRKAVLALAVVGIIAVKQNKYAGNYAEMPASEHKGGQIPPQR